MFSWVSPGPLRRINWVYFLWCRHWCLATGEYCRILFFSPSCTHWNLCGILWKFTPTMWLMIVWDIAEEWQKNGQIYIVLSPCVLPMLGVSETITQDGFSFITTIRDTVKQCLPSGKDALTRACGSLNSADLLVMRDFQSLTKEAYFWFSSHGPKRFVCAKERKVVLAGQCLCTAMPGKQVGSHHGTALESSHSWAAAFRDPLLQDGARVLVELLSPLFVLLQHGEPWRKSGFLLVCSLTGAPAQN